MINHFPFPGLGCGKILNCLFLISNYLIALGFYVNGRKTYINKKIPALFKYPGFVIVYFILNAGLVIYEKNQIKFSELELNEFMNLTELNFNSDSKNSFNRVHSKTQST